MKTIPTLLLAASLLPAPAAAQAAPPEPQFAEGPVLPEVVTAVELSNRDVNRISCPGRLKDVTTSEEKGVQVKIVGGDAFVKFLVRKTGEEKTYAATPTEFFAVCDDSVYQLIGFPKDIPSRTVRLGAGMKDAVKANLERFQSMAVEEKASRLVREAYRGDFPESYTVRRTEIPVGGYRDLRITLREVVDVEGEGLRLKKYELEGAAPGLELTEKQFAGPAFGENIIFIALEDLRLAAAGDRTNLYVVETRQERP
ncbi:MAG: type-F conjugative transfer system secretin TraK [Desulfobacteraceae bacterium]|nr:type-F conjugative transfer system secretin TraK [Desulfobacteraceae bacterium]